VSVEFALDGTAAPPMKNGELVFEAPWQGRAFGIARGMAERGVYAWDDFRARLIAEVGAYDRRAETMVRDGGVAPAFSYYEHFLRALEALLVERAIIVRGELVARVHAFEERPHGHDHDRGRDHDRAHEHDDGHQHGHARDDDHDE
jgi:nitrile hydratase accessory protein